jgi:hypothetical protein
VEAKRKAKDLDYNEVSIKLDQDSKRNKVAECNRALLELKDDEKKIQSAIDKAEEEIIKLRGYFGDGASETRLDWIGLDLLELELVLVLVCSFVCLLCPFCFFRFVCFVFGFWIGFVSVSVSVSVFFFLGLNLKFRLGCEQRHQSGQRGPGGDC